MPAAEESPTAPYGAALSCQGMAATIAGHRGGCGAPRALRSLFFCAGQAPAQQRGIGKVHM